MLSNELAQVELFRCLELGPRKTREFQFECLEDGNSRAMLQIGEKTTEDDDGPRGVSLEELEKDFSASLKISEAGGLGLILLQVSPSLENRILGKGENNIRLWKWVQPDLVSDPSDRACNILVLDSPLR